MRKTSFLSAIILLGMLISACGAQAALPEKAARASFTANVEAAADLAAAPGLTPSATARPLTPTSRPSPTRTQQPSPSPSPSPSASPTATPWPVKIAVDSLEDLQVVRFSNMYPDEETEIFHRFLSADTRLMAESGCRNNDIDVCYHPVFHLVDVDSGEVLRDLDVLAPYIHIAQFSPDNKVLAVGGCNIALYLVGEPDTLCTEPRLWLIDTASGKKTFELKKYNSTIQSLLFSADGAKLYVGVRYFKKTSENDSSVRVWDVASGKLVDEFQPDIVNCMDVTLQFAPGERFLITRYRSPCSGDSYVKWWDMQKRSIRPHGGGQGYKYALSPDGTRIAVQESYDNVALLIYDLDSAQRIAYLPGLGRSGELIQFDFLNDPNTLFVSKYDSLKVFDLTSGKSIREIRRPKDAYISSAQLSPDRTLLLTSGSGEISDSFFYSGSLWNTTTWQETPLKAFWEQSLYSARGQFSPDQQRIVFIDMFGMGVWGLPAAEQESALTALLGYLDLLAKGDYARAAGYQTLDDEFYYTSTLAEMVPEAEPGDLEGVIRALCQDERFPCLPVKDVVYRSQIAEDRYLFVVNFSQPDGTAAVWPLCVGVPAAKSCFRRDGMFEYQVVREANGEFKILNSLPPAIDLRVEQ